MAVLTEDLGFIHRFEPGERSGEPTLLLLHGTGGDENDLFRLGQMIAPGAAMLSPRGKVLEDGAPRFFRRLREGVFDQQDLALRTAELRDFVDRAREQYGLGKIVPIGFSNGANMAVSLLLNQFDEKNDPGQIEAAVLMRPMLPYSPQRIPDLTGMPVLILSGYLDPIVPVEQPEYLKRVLESAGAAVTIHWEDTGHALANRDLVVARDWLRRILPRSDGR